MKLSREDLERMIKEETEDLLGEKANPAKFDPARFPLKLSDVDPMQSKIAVSHGHSKYDQDPNDDEINVDETLGYWINRSILAMILIAFYTILI